jgi:hypothetical protein
MMLKGILWRPNPIVLGFYEIYRLLLDLRIISSIMYAFYNYTI